jgi:NCS1 family nucleobase:cation symporter-1
MSNASTTTDQTQTLAGRDAAAVEDELIEKRSIDHVPQSERHGRPRDLGPIWFSSNATLATIATGLVGVAAGGSLIWTLVALILGLAFGTLFMAFHSIQGPRLGLPQMIQSRAQFGYIGSAVPLLVALILYGGFSVFNLILIAEAVHVFVALPIWLLLLAGTILSALLAIFGYVWIHRVQRWLTYLFFAGYGIFTIAVLFAVHPSSAAVSGGGFSAVPFFLQFAVAVGYQVSLAPYVSDYSRYLPEDSSERKVFLWTYFPSLASALWLTALGAFLQAAYPNLEPIEAIHRAGDSVFSGFGVIGLLIAVPGTIAITTMNAYGAGLTALSLIDTVKRIDAGSRALRISSICAIMGVVFVLADAASGNFLTNFSDLLLFLLYFLVPWTSVNLVDFYVVRRGHYALGELFKPRGIYGLFGWRGLTSYAVGLLVMVPFFSTTIYTGPVANSINGIDLSIFIGVPVSALAYVVLSRIGTHRTPEEEERIGESVEEVSLA